LLTLITSWKFYLTHNYNL